MKNNLLGYRLCPFACNGCQCPTIAVKRYRGDSLQGEYGSCDCGMTLRPKSRHSDLILIPRSGLLDSPESCLIPKKSGKSGREDAKIQTINDQAIPKPSQKSAESGEKDYFTIMGGG